MADDAMLNRQALEFAMWEYAAGALGFVVGILARTVAPFAVDFLQEKIICYVAKSGYRVGMTNQLGGDWHHVWYAKGSATWPDENKCRVSMSALGRHSAGVYEYMGSRWLVYARLEPDFVVFGTWKQLTPKGYKGTWLGKRDLSNKSMHGWYLGSSERGPTGAGEWIWWRDGEGRPNPPIAIIQPATR